jgi:hypothetical protein
MIASGLPNKALCTAKPIGYDTAQHTLMVHAGCALSGLKVLETLRHLVLRPLAIQAWEDRSELRPRGQT